MAVLTTIPNGASVKDITDTINSLMALAVTLKEKIRFFAPPLFATYPTIEGATTRIAGDTFSYNPGVIVNGDLGEVTLMKDNVVLKTLSNGSGTFGSAGVYKIRTYIDDTNIAAYSDEITVTAAP